MRRHLIGIMSIGLLLAGTACLLWSPEGSVGFQQFEAASFRMGALLAVLWLAFAEIERMPGWLMPLLLAVLAVVALRPRLILFALPILIVLAILKPRFGRRR